MCERLRDAVLLLRFLKLMGFPNAYGELVRGYTVKGEPCGDLLSRWRSSGFSVVSLDRLGIILHFPDSLDGVSIFSNLSWGVDLVGGLSDNEESFLEGLGGYRMGSKVLLGLGLFLDLLSAGIFEWGDIERVSFVCEAGKWVPYMGHLVEMYLFSYILGVGGSFSVLGGGLSVGDWSMEREFMRDFLSCGIVEDICALLFSVGGIEDEF